MFGWIENNRFYLSHVFRSPRRVGPKWLRLKRTSPRSWHGYVGSYELYLDWIFRQPNAREALADARFLVWRGRQHV